MQPDQKEDTKAVNADKDIAPIEPDDPLLQYVWEIVKRVADYQEGQEQTVNPYRNPAGVPNSPDNL